MRLVFPTYFKKIFSNFGFFGEHILTYRVEIPYFNKIFIIYFAFVYFKF